MSTANQLLLSPRLRWWLTMFAVSLLTYTLITAVTPTTTWQIGEPSTRSTVQRIALPAAQPPSHSMPEAISVQSPRLDNFFAKLDRGEAVRLAVTGGSNSEGARLANSSNNAFRKLERWLNEWKPLASGERHTVKIHARGATTSDLGSWCVMNLVPTLQQSPTEPAVDLLFVDYAANDLFDHDVSTVGQESAVNQSQLVEANMERLARTVLQRADNAALFFVYFTRVWAGTYSNAEASHEVVRKHYDIPHVSLRAQLERMRADEPWSLLFAGKFDSAQHEWNDEHEVEHDISKQLFHDDPSHASDLGHLLVFDSIRNKLVEEFHAYRSRLQHAGRALALSTVGSAAHTLPPPLHASTIGLNFAGQCMLAERTWVALETAEAQERYHVLYNHGWNYQSLNGNAAKLGWSPTVVGASLHITLPLASQQLKEVHIIYMRTWRNDTGTCSAWLSCSSGHTGVPYNALVLDSHWELGFTQAAVARVMSGGQVDGGDEQPACRIDTLNLKLESDGDFMLYGYIVE